MKKLTILDGGMGRELKRIGAPFSQPLWSAQALIESPDHVRQAHQSFIDAGAEIIIVNSYACVPFHLGDELFQSDGAALAAKAAAIARTVVQQGTAQGHPPVLVAGCIPPVFGSYRPDLFKADQAEAIITTLFNAQDPYVDIWIAETIASLEEFEAVHAVLKQCDKACYYAFTLEDSVSEQARLRSGEMVKEAAEQVCQTNARGLFFNCSIPEVMEQGIIDAQKVMTDRSADIEIGVYANNFSPTPSNHKANDCLQSMRELSPQDYLLWAMRWHELGATTVGGCCGIGPGHIKRLAEFSYKLEAGMIW